MARPTKQGIEYFPIDCQFDDKIEMYIAEKGAIGLAVLITIWQLIYHNEGYYITRKDLDILIKRRINVDINEVNVCINLCLCRHIFDQNQYKTHGILTSKAIQRRYFEAAKRKKTVQYDVNYLINGVNVCKSGVNVVHLSPKEEVKEEVKEDSGVFKKPTIVEIKTYCTERKNNVSAESFFDFYESKGWKIGKNNMKNWKAAVRTWERQYGDIQKNSKRETVY